MTSITFTGTPAINNDNMTSSSHDISHDYWPVIPVSSLIISLGVGSKGSLLPEV